MPVKVRCECGKVMTVPDAARGRKVKCRDCGESVKVPSDEEPSRRKKKTEAVSVDDENFLARIDLDEAEHEEIRICPRCAARLSESDVECPKCRIDLETGKLSEKNKYKKKRGGPDPDLFYKAAWVDSWAFLKKNPGLALSLGIFTSIAATLVCGAAFMAQYCERKPLVLFWGCLAITAQMALSGSFLQLWLEIIKATLAEKDELNRFKFDYFAAVALGIKATLWPVAINFLVTGPLLFIGAILFQFEMISQDDLQNPVVAGVAGLLYLLPLFAWPIAVIHMSVRYTFKAYIPYDMIRIVFRNFAPVAWWWLLVIVVNVLTIGAAVAVGLFANDLYLKFGEIVLKLIEVCGISTAEEQRGFLFSLAFPFISGASLFLGILPITLLSAFSAVYVMRAGGLLAYYRDRELETGHKVIANQIAGFWIRYLAYLVDLCVCLSFALMCGGLFGGFAAFMEYMQVDLGSTIKSVSILAINALCLAYFVLSESGPSSATMGQKSMGLIVVTDDYKRPITRGAAFMRFIVRNIGIHLLGLGVLAMLWDKEKKTLHDRATKTRVVWRPVID